MWRFLQVRKGLDWMSYYLIRACEETAPTGMLFTVISPPPARPLSTCRTSSPSVLFAFSQFPCWPRQTDKPFRWSLTPALAFKATDHFSVVGDWCVMGMATMQIKNWITDQNLVEQMQLSQRLPGKHFFRISSTCDLWSKLYSHWSGERSRTGMHSGFWFCS